MEIDAHDQELLVETAMRILEGGSDMDAALEESVRAVAYGAEITIAQVSDVVRAGRHVWSDQEWLAMDLYSLIV
jgi:hypothetical protein